jgi:hypothetical protein
MAFCLLGVSLDGIFDGPLSGVCAVPSSPSRPVVRAELFERCVYGLLPFVIM